MTLILSGTDGLSDIDGSAATPAIRGTDANTGIFFPAADTIAFAEGGTEAMRIDSSGNVLVGTANTPSNRDTVTPKLIVNGAGVEGSMQVVRNTTVGGGGGIIELTSTRGTNVNSYTILQNGDGIGSVIFGGADGNEFVQAASIIAQVDGTPGDNDMPGRLLFNTTADGASSTTERMRIDSSGNLLVGTTSSGGVGFTVAADAAGRILTSNVSAVPFDVYLFKNSGTTVGKITINTSSTAYTTTSDYRLKENVTPLTSALSVVNQLKPVNFTWKLSGESTQGFIAHELQEVVPDCVAGEKDAVDAEGNPQYQGVDTSFLVATLTAAIQELKALTDTQASTITALTARITALETQNANNPPQGETP